MAMTKSGDGSKGGRFVNSEDKKRKDFLETADFIICEYKNFLKKVGSL